jgi:hypothetical protein
MSAIARRNQKRMKNAEPFLFDPVDCERLPRRPKHELTRFNENAQNAQMYQRLQQCAAVPDFNNYLAFILTTGVGAA